MLSGKDGLRNDQINASSKQFRLVSEKSTTYSCVVRCEYSLLDVGGV